MKKLFFISAMLIGNIAYSFPFLSCDEVSMTCRYRTTKILFEISHYDLLQNRYMICDYRKNQKLHLLDPLDSVLGRYKIENGCERDLLLERFISTPKGSQIVFEMKTRLDSLKEQRKMREKNDVYRYKFF